MWRKKLDLQAIALGIKKYKWAVGLGLLLLVAYAFCLPHPLFKDPHSTILLDRDGELLGARIAADEQWRFPENDTIPTLFKQTIIAFEDKRFYYHFGLDPLAMLRAAYLNVVNRKIISGGSTLSMQVIRLSRKGKSRTLWEKLVEIVLATRMELSYTKEEILAKYAAHAPFGGNVVGLETAAWKYYGRSASQLSLGEMAALAVLPNAPSLIHPGRNRGLLLTKRNNLISKMLAFGQIDSVSAGLAMTEPLPERPLPLPSNAPHLLERIHQKHLKNPALKTSYQSTLQRSIQQRANAIIARYGRLLSRNGVFNAAAIIAEVQTGDVIAYIGNTPAFGEEEHGNDVDIIRASRSTGSILKPFLFASMLNDGEILPGSLVPDVPSYYSGYNPSNFTRSYGGAVPARDALARSLNIPAVRMLSEHGVDKFHEVLRQLGMRSLNRSADEYGLTLVLGGAEGSLWDVSGMYASMARSLALYPFYRSRYEPDNYRALNTDLSASHDIYKEDEFEDLQSQQLLSAASVWHTFEAMIAVSRPNVDRYWERFSSSQKIAWKTGTSYGSRDAWAIGCNPQYVVGVWAGNADGEGRPGLSGAQVAAPIMFDLFNLLEGDEQWFLAPYEEMEELEICKQSGYLPGPHCHEKVRQWVPEKGIDTKVCPYHKRVHLQQDEAFQVHLACEDEAAVIHKSWFVLPPVQAFYYRRKHPEYKSLPPMRADCMQSGALLVKDMDLIYPKHDAQIYVPIGLDGKPSSTVFELTHRRDDARIYWHLDQYYLGMTTGTHQMALNPPVGKHTITFVDEQGKTLTRSFEILAKE